MDPLLSQARLDIQERIKALPEDVASVITDGTLDATILLIQDKYPLTADQITLLENEIILVLTLFFLPVDFVDNIEESLGIQRPTAEAISADIHENIFDLFEDFFEIVEKSQKEIEAGTNIEAVPAVIAKKMELKNLAQTFGQPSAERLENPEVHTLTENVEPLRTMEGDMNRIHGYGAYREEQTDTEAGDDAKSNETLPS